MSTLWAGWTRYDVVHVKTRLQYRGPQLEEMRWLMWTTDEARSAQGIHGNKLRTSSGRSSPVDLEPTPSCAQLCSQGCVLGGKKKERSRQPRSQGSKARCESHTQTMYKNKNKRIDASKQTALFLSYKFRSVVGSRKMCFQGMVGMSLVMARFDEARWSSRKQAPFFIIVVCFVEPTVGIHTLGPPP